MDGGKDSSRRNTLLGGIGSSIWNLIPKFISEQCQDSLDVPNNQQFGSFKNESCIDLDKSDSEDECGNLETSKRSYNARLINELRNERSKRGSEKEDGDILNVKRARLNISVNNAKVQADNSQYTDQSRSSFSYRNICTTMDAPVTKNDRGIFLHNSDSAHSLSASMNESFQSTTASRISANLFSHRLACIDHQNDSPRPQSRALRTPYSHGNRRYRTVMKKDTISSYLSRESLAQESILSPSSISAPLSFTLDNTKEAYRFDLSQLRKTPIDTSYEVKNERQWKCDQCSTINPINFNFCPSCANANPLNISHTQSATVEPYIDPSGWKCPRCSTFNADERRVCLCCFMAKGSELKRHFGSTSGRQGTVPGLADSLKRVFGDRDADAREICSEITETNTNDTDITMLGKFSKNIWSCPTCMVDNDLEIELCACCLTAKPDAKVQTKQTHGFVLGNQNQSIPHVKLGNSKELSRFKFGNTYGMVKSKVSTLHPNVKWNCPVCMVENMPEKAECVCCRTMNLSPITTELPMKDCNAAMWNCPTCFVDNEKLSATCVCCSTKNPNEANVSGLFGQLISTSASNNIGGSSKIRFGADMVNEATTTFIFGSGIKEQISSPIKFGANCVSVSIKAPQAPLTTNEGAPESKWVCPTCMVENEAQKTECVCCTTKKPFISSPEGHLKLGNGPDKGSITEKKTCISNIFETSSQTTKWQCPTCLAENGIERESCACCTTKNSSSKVPSSTFTFGHTKPTSASSFTFGQTIEPSSSSSLVVGTCNPSSTSSKVNLLTPSTSGTVCPVITSPISAQLNPYMSIFGQSNASPLVFGQSNACPLVFGQANASSLVFGQANASPLVFGQANASPLVFGQANASPLVFGQANASPLVFGQANTPSLVFGAPSSILGTVNSLPSSAAPSGPSSTFVAPNLPSTIFGQVGSQSSKLSNGLDKLASSFTFGGKKESSSEDKSDCLDFSFSKPKVMEYESKVDLDGDIEFEFSSAEVV